MKIKFLVVLSTLGKSEIHYLTEIWLNMKWITSQDGFVHVDPGSLRVRIIISQFTSPHQDGD